MLFAFILERGKLMRGSKREGEGLWPVHSSAVRRSDLSDRPALSGFNAWLYYHGWRSMRVNDRSSAKKGERNERSCVPTAHSFITGRGNAFPIPTSAGWIMYPPLWSSINILWLRLANFSPFKCAPFSLEILSSCNREKQICEIKNKIKHTPLFSGFWAANVRSFGWHQPPPTAALVPIWGLAFFGESAPPFVRLFSSGRPPQTHNSTSLYHSRATGRHNHQHYGASIGLIYKAGRGTGSASREGENMRLLAVAKPVSLLTACDEGERKMFKLEKKLFGALICLNEWIKTLNELSDCGKRPKHKLQFWR